MISKSTILSFVFACSLLLCYNNSQAQQQTAPKPGMFKVTIFYPNGEGKTFDMDYYENKHMPMVAGFIGKNLQLYEIDKGISGRTSNDKVPFLAIGYFYVNNMDEYNKAIAQKRDTIVGDFKNYTNIQPMVQISEIKQIKYSTK